MNEEEKNASKLHLYRIRSGQVLSEYLADRSCAPRARMEKNQCT